MSNTFKLKAEFNRKYAELSTRHSDYEEYAGWTIPTVFPREDINLNDEMQHDYQSVGAQAVNHLANRLVSTLFQPNRPFFRMDFLEEQYLEIEEDTGYERSEIEVALASAEKQAMKQLQRVKATTALTDVMKNLIITGNAMLYYPDNGKPIQAYGMRDYVVDRDLYGEVHRTIIKETKRVSNLSRDLQLKAKFFGFKFEDDIDLYTCVKRQENGRWFVTQEADDKFISHEVMGNYPKGRCPYIPLTWNLARGMDYGTGLVEDYAGDFHTLSTSEESLTSFTAAVMDIKNLVNPAGMTDLKALMASPSGSYVYGVEGDIVAHTAQVPAGIQFVLQRMETITRRIGSGFMLTSQMTRDAERVTAEEIRMLAAELEGSLGGIYSRLAEELQLPLATMLISALEPVFSSVNPEIITGLEALTRSSELDDIKMFIGDLALIADVPPSLAAWIDDEKIIQVIGASRNVDYAKFMRTAKEVDTKREQDMEALKQQQTNEAVAKGAANMVTE